MATIGTDITLRDVARRLDPDGKIDMIAEILNDYNEILQDIPWVESNLPTGHVSTQRTGLPTSFWRLLNQGVPDSKSTTKQITDGVGMLEAWGEVDKDLAELNGNSAAFRMSEDKAHLESMSQEFASTLIYGSTATAPEEFNGMAVRYDSIGTDDTLASYNVIDGGGSGADNTSVYLFGFSPETCFGIYPKGSKAGLMMEDLGLDTVLDSNSYKYRAYRSHYQWKCGLVVRDWRYCVRIANIDYSNLISGSGAADLVDLMIQAEEKIPNLAGVRLAYACRREVRTALRQQILAKNNVNLTYDTVAGKRVLAFNEIPVRRMDALLANESAVS